MEKRNMFKCNLCDSLYSSITSLTEHQLLVHYPIRLEKKESIGVLGSTRKNRYRYIPKAAIDSLAARFELGQEKHGVGAMNGLENTEKLTKEWVIARLEHVIDHAFRAIKYIHDHDYYNLQQEGVDDDAGAILFGGAILALWNELKANQSEQAYKQPSDTGNQTSGNITTFE